MNGIFHRKIGKQECADTGMAMVLLALLGYLYSGRQGVLYAAIALQVVNMTWPRVFQPAAVVWLGLSHALGTVVSKILLSVVFFVVVTPIALLRKMAGKDSLLLRAFKAGRGSAMVRRNHTFVAADIERPY